MERGKSSTEFKLNTLWCFRIHWVMMNSQHDVNQCLRIFDKMKTSFSLLESLHRSFTGNFLWKHCQPSWLCEKLPLCPDYRLWIRVQSPRGKVKKKRIWSKNVKSRILTRWMWREREDNTLYPTCWDGLHQEDQGESHSWLQATEVRGKSGGCLS